MSHKSTAKILDQLAKLKRHEASSRRIGSEAEANAFAHRITVLLEKYRLEESEIDLSREATEEEIKSHYVNWRDHGMKNTGRRCWWTEDLAAVVARFNVTYALTPMAWTLVTSRSTYFRTRRFARRTSRRE